MLSCCPSPPPNSHYPSKLDGFCLLINALKAIQSVILVVLATRNQIKRTVFSTL